jgi:hypothetical protein
MGIFFPPKARARRYKSCTVTGMGLGQMSKKEDRKKEREKMEEEGKEKRPKGKKKKDKKDPEKVNQEAEKVKLLALLKAVREEMDKPVLKGMKVRDFADIFVDRYNFFHERVGALFPSTDFNDIFVKLSKGGTSLEKIRMEISLLIAYIQNDIMDIIEQAERLKQKNKWLRDRLREFEIKIAGIQAIK